jgi:hypothetical protein
MSYRDMRIILSIFSILVGLSISSCGGGGGGGSSSPPASVAQPVLTAQFTPSGYVLPTSTALGSSNVYISSNSDGILTGLALPQGTLASPLQISAPSGITVSSLVSTFVQQFSSSPLALVISNITGGIIVNVSASPLSSSDSKAYLNGTVTWNAYTFNNLTPTSIPVAVSAANGGAYVGVNVNNNGGGLLAFQSSPNTSTAAVALANQSQCTTATSSTSATSIANTTITGGTSAGNYIGIGTNNGELLIYGITGTNTGLCKNLTNSSRALTAYSLGSPIVAISFTSLNSNNYGYFLTGNGQIWRIVADINNNPLSFTQLNGAGFSGTVPPSGAGNLTALFSDSSNNVFVGSSSGMVYLLAAGSGVNTTWSGTNMDRSAISSISATSNGSIIAATSSNIYNVTIR